MLACWMGCANAAPIYLSGAVSYNYNWSKYANADSTSQSIMGTVNASSYIWQPWFVQWSASVSLSESTSDGQGTETTTSLVTGAIDFSVFPSSRFPLELGYSRDSSASDAVGVFMVSSSEYVTTRKRLGQSYNSPSGLYARGNYTSSSWEGSDSRSAEFTTLGLTVNKRFQHQNVSFSYNQSESENSSSDQIPKNYSYILNHQYYPANTFNVNTSFSQKKDQLNLKSGGSFDYNEVMRLHSTFSWRPVYRIFSLNGGMDFFDEKNSTTSLSGYAGVSYNFTNNLSLSGTISAGITDSAGGLRSENSSQSINIGYSGDVIYFLKFAYNWQPSANMTNSAYRTDVDSSSSTSESAGFNHSVSRGFRPTSNSSINAGVGQSIQGTKSDQTDGVITSLAHNGNVSWTHNTSSATTSAWVSLSDTRVSGGAGSQTYEVSLNRTDNLTRLSSLTGQISYRGSRLKGDDFATTSSGSASYTHGRLFGVYQLQFASTLSLSEKAEAESYAGLDRYFTTWRNILNYRIGLLTTSLEVNLVDSGDERFTMVMFSVTRSF